MADATIQQSRYPKVMRQWPLGCSRHGPVDDYPGLTAVRKDYRLAETDAGAISNQVKAKDCQDCTNIITRRWDSWGSRDKQEYASGVLVSVYLGEG